MGALGSYKKAIQKAETQAGLQLRLRQEGDHLWIGGIKFTLASRADLFRKERFEKGILIRDLSTEEKKYCQSHEISYLTSHGELFLIGNEYRVALEPNRKKRRPVQRSKIKRSESLAIPLQPTLLISPNGLAILDILFRIPNGKIQNYKSALSFIHEFKLNQPKLSQMMTRLRVKTLGELKTAIKALPDDWWKIALRYPMTRKRLTPFFEVAKPYHSLRSDLPQLEIKDSLVPGPVEVMRELGLIRDPDRYLWGAASAFQELKNKFRLIPGEGSNAVTWHLATPVGGLERESILSPLHATNTNFRFPSLRTNLFRSIWDLSFGDERLREVQLLALRRILDEV